MNSCAGGEQGLRGLLSVGTQSHKKEENAYEILGDLCENVDPANRLYVVHRLDRDTSGLMMFAKSEEAQEVLRHNWNNVILQRLYVAVLEGYLEEEARGMSKAVWPRIRSLWSIPPTILMKAGWR